MKIRRPLAPSAFIVAIVSRPPVEVTFDRVADADAADQKCRESDDREELRKAFDVAFELRRGIAAAADIPSGFGQLRARLRGQRFRGGIGRIVRGQAQTIVPTHQTAGLQQTGRA